ncbi:hypothetical protein [Streptomyces palmae]|uniref:Uncharacterized protein n=1 Tax=Streptomyces palmae TaxID=1701085 RepID=A0A4Z0HD17_9ACTN|nr:hypothetical protein [Streptomyces palmae]TGB15182.1 hypothetical protein E4099_07145 [Streptomyces palmae]
MSGLAPGTEAALAPVREELLRRAHAEAAAHLSAADREAEDLLRDAAAKAEGIAAQARRQGEAEGAWAARAVLADARRTAGECELAARREVYEDLRRQVLARVRALRRAPEYPALLDRLVRRARRLLGPEARVTEAPLGGCVAVAGHRRVDQTLDALATRALESLGSEVESLWTP